MSIHDLQVSESPSLPLVSLQGVSKAFRSKKQSVHALRGIDLDIEEGELLVLLGPSGCGKTTLLRCLAGLERPSEGRIAIGGQIVADAKEGVFRPANKRDIGMVFQNYALWPHLTVWKNVAFPLKARRRESSAADLGKRVEEMLALVQCQEFGSRYPGELSGGQQQRVSLARALASRPRLLLMDEPLSNLDALLRIDMRHEIRRLHREVGFTAVYVTHDQEEAIALGTRIIVMHDGGFDQIGTPTDLLQRPATEFVARFLGWQNVMELDIRGAGDASLCGGGVATPASKSFVRGHYRVRLKAAATKLRPQGSGPDGGPTIWSTMKSHVTEVLEAGGQREYVVQHGDHDHYVTSPPSEAILPRGTWVEVGFDIATALAYDSDDGQLRDVCGETSAQVSSGGVAR